MSNLLFRAIHILVNEGPITLARRVSVFVKSNLPSYHSLGFLLKERGEGPRNDTIMLTLRASTFDSDTLSIVVAAAKKPRLSTVYIAVPSADQFETIHRDINHHLDNLDIEIKPVSIHSPEFKQGFMNSHIVFIRGSRDLLDYRILNRNSDRKFVQIYHGFAKASGNFKKGKLTDKTTTIRYQKPFITALFHAVDMYSVSTDVEWFYRSAANGTDPSIINKCGYPKYNRIRKLENSGEEPIIPKKSKMTLESDDSQYKILYAPTHKGDYEQTTLFPFPMYESEQLSQFLQSIDATMYIRTHVSEEKAGVYDDIVDGTTIKYAGQEFSSSAAEILPYFDMLITDYSSIYTEYLTLDRPILFMIDESNPYWKEHGFAFQNEVYFPGITVESFDQLITQIEAHLQDESIYSNERKLASQLLIPSDDRDFLNCVHKNLYNK